jgi:mRNA-degrading endonuclease toxin of MazEF toxin-antitoxin module
MNKYKKGDVVLVSFTDEVDGQAQEKRRPAVVISIDDLADDVLVAPLTTNLPTAQSDLSAIVLRKASKGRQAAGLRQDCVIDCSVAAAIPRALVVNKIGQVSAEIMARIDEAMGRGGGDNT